MKLLIALISSSAYAANPICALDGIEYPGFDVVGSGPQGSIEDVGMPDNCAENCRFSSQCVAWSYRKSRYECYLHTSANQMTRETGWICGNNKSSQKTDSNKYNDPNLITGNFIPGIKDSMTCQYICQTSRYCFYFSYNENMGHCYIKFSGAGTVDPINHGEGSGWYSGYYNCGGNQT